ncbi:galactose oxidase [Gigaspora margarita]|uniref:Galactose oxidase n=1 Tax=Gigaspora margarita TaxID=4874 RepID=A0A8H4B0C9_GIGMA|nr:galactose oxidase [Gigaspora margarita]
MTWSTILPQLQNVDISTDYATVLLPDGVIVYIGGRAVAGVARSDLNHTIDGSSIEPRNGHSAVLTKRGDIIVYGGETSTNGTNPMQSDVLVLDTNTWEWSNPNISSINAPPPLLGHSAAIYGNYMILAFGQASSTHYNNIYILDVEHYTWVTTITSAN